MANYISIDSLNCLSPLEEVMTETTTTSTYDRSLHELAISQISSQTELTQQIPAKNKVSWRPLHEEQLFYISKPPVVSTKQYLAEQRAEMRARPPSPFTVDLSEERQMIEVFVQNPKNINKEDIERIVSGLKEKYKECASVRETAKKKYDEYSSKSNDFKSMYKNLSGIFVDQCVSNNLVDEDLEGRGLIQECRKMLFKEEVSPSPIWQKVIQGIKIDFKKKLPCRSLKESLQLYESGSFSYRKAGKEQLVECLIFEKMMDVLLEGLQILQQASKEANLGLSDELFNLA